MNRSLEIDGVADADTSKMEQERISCRAVPELQPEDHLIVFLVGDGIDPLDIAHVGRFFEYLPGPEIQLLFNVPVIDRHDVVPIG